MAKERIEVGKAPQIILGSCEGDLVVHGWSEPALLLKRDFSVEETDKGYRIVGRGALRLTAPTEASLRVEDVAGDLVVKGIMGSIEVGHVHGDAILAEAGPANLVEVHGDLVARGGQTLSLGSVHGDVAARRVGGLAVQAVYGDLVLRRAAGPVVVDEASGDVMLRGIDGDVTVGRAHRDVNLAFLSGQVMVGQADGDIRLRGPLAEGEHALAAHGDVVLRWPVNIPVQLVAAGRRIDNRLPLQDVVEKDGRLTARIGEGGPQLTLSADGGVILKAADPVDEKWDFAFDEGDFEFAKGDFVFGAAIEGLEVDKIAARVEAEVNSHLARVARDIESRFGPEFGQRMAEKVAKQAERAAERAERAAERARRKSEWRGRGVGFDAPPAPARRTVSAEEQMKILKMVESGAITPEDAGMLLEALEG
jgi:hypothetical protein